MILWWSNKSLEIQDKLFPHQNNAYMQWKLHSSSLYVIVNKSPDMYGAPLYLASPFVKMLTWTCHELQILLSGWHECRCAQKQHRKMWQGVSHKLGSLFLPAVKGLGLRLLYVLGHFIRRFTFLSWLSHLMLLFIILIIPINFHQFPILFSSFIPIILL